MTTKNDFTPEEWNTIVAAPSYAAILVVVSDFNVTYFKEVAAMAKAVMASIEGSKFELIKSVAGEYQDKDAMEAIKPELEKLRGLKDPTELKSAMNEYVVKSAELVSAKSIEDGEAFRKWLVYLAEKAAEGSREGGFLGIGSVLVSEQEEEALNELADALGVARKI
ncbi:MAG: hypothetical protein ACK2U3_01995 [Anaerolineales bacterium]|jgi:hypothetical protein